MHTHSKPVILETTIAVSSNDLIATDNIMEVITWAKRHKQQLESAKKLYDEAVEMLKAFMQSRDTLISPDGCKLATWKQQKDRMKLDEDALKLNFADIYAICCETKPGNRPFILE
jgi:hypothetical protein